MKISLNEKPLVEDAIERTLEYALEMGWDENTFPYLSGDELTVDFGTLAGTVFAVTYHSLKKEGVVYAGHIRLS